MLGVRCTTSHQPPRSEHSAPVTMLFSRLNTHFWGAINQEKGVKQEGEGAQLAAGTSAIQNQWPMSKVGPLGTDVPPHPPSPPKRSSPAGVGEAARSFPPSRRPRHGRTDGHESQQPQPNPLRSPALWKDKEPSLLCQ